MPRQSKVVFIVGASSGIGYGLAIEFAARGWTVYAGSRNVAKMASLRDKNINVLALDVNDQESIDNARDLIIKETNGQLDVLYLNAGIGHMGSILDTPLEDIEGLFQTNTFGSIRIIKSFQDLLLKNRATVAFTGSVIVTSTIPFMYAYAASKASFDILAHYLAMECGSLGIKVVNVRSAAVESDIYDTPKFIPKEGSLYYTGKEEAIGAIDLDRMATAKYCKKAVTAVEKTVKNGTTFKELYYGQGASFSWFMNTFIPYGPYFWAILRMSKMNKVFAAINEKLAKEARA